jgi:uncharacterized membrane protein
VSNVTHDEASDRESAAETDAAYSSARAKSFVDAVVAIAMTLLILPLVDSFTASTESVTASTQPLPDAATWFGGHASLLFASGVSFVVIALFWIEHHRMYARVHRVTVDLLWLNVAWLATIVWMPVATAMSEEMQSNDDLSVTVYIGSMALASVLALAQRLFLRRRKDLHDASESQLRSGIAVDLSMVTLFLVSLAIAILFPLVNYFALFLLMLTEPLQRLYARLLRVRAPATHS